MKPYGLDIVEWPDVRDIIEMGAKSCTGQVLNKSSVYRGYCNRRRKRQTRRYWKRKERRAGREEIEEQLEEKSNKNQMKHKTKINVKEPEDCPFWTYYDGPLCIYPLEDFDPEPRYCEVALQNPEGCPIKDGLSVVIDK